MPLGIPRIVYSWGEDAGANWTDLYNFIFRRRMIFVMQYLDDELCNQICGLLINIHMEDRAKEMEKEQMDKSGLFGHNKATDSNRTNTTAASQAKSKSATLTAKDAQDLLMSEDIDIDENHALEQYYLQQIEEGALSLGKNLNNNEFLNTSLSTNGAMFSDVELKQIIKSSSINQTDTNTNPLNTYAPFREIVKFTPERFNFHDVNTKAERSLSLRKVKSAYKQDTGYTTTTSNLNKGLVSSASPKGMRTSTASSLLDFTSNSYNLESIYNSRELYRKQAERTLQEEENKKVFVLINSFGGSVSHGITVHDALQFIKAGSTTLNLGVAASAASMVLAGGNIGERFITEGAHTMLHQVEASINGQASDIYIDAKEVIRIKLDVADIYSLSTYRPRHKILRDLDRDFYLNANETVQYGLADEIATNEVISEVIESVNRVWAYHEGHQQRLLETIERQVDTH